MRKYNTILSLFVLFLIFNMIFKPALYIEATLNGITAWAFNVLPSVLPFMFFTKVLSSLGTTEKLSRVFGQASQKLFKTPPISAFVFLTSAVSGYPIGAKMTADLYSNGKISKSEAFKMCSFCNTSGPMFIVGAVGVGMLGNPIYGYIILISHLIGAILNGILYRKLKVREEVDEEKIAFKQDKQDLSGMIVDSCLSIISVGAIIAIFFVVITALSPVFSIFPAKLSPILQGMIEITKGCKEIGLALHGFGAVIASTFVISFGGLSTILQSLTMLNRLKMPVKLFCLQKFTHAILSTLVSVVLCLIII